jgi:hypothetical protein
MRIRIWIRANADPDVDPDPDPDPDPGFDDQKLKKKIQLSKENIRHFNTSLFHFYIFEGNFCPPGCESG